MKIPKFMVVQFNRESHPYIIAISQYIIAFFYLYHSKNSSFMQHKKLLKLHNFHSNNEIMLSIKTENGIKILKTNSVKHRNPI